MAAAKGRARLLAIAPANMIGRSQLRPLLAAGWLLCGWGATAIAATVDDVFTVSGVTVDVTTDAAATARTAAIAEGQREAFDRLLRRITLRADHERHPDLDDTAVTALVQDFRIAEEKASTVRYIATLTVRFKADAVRRLLRQAGIAHTETPSKPLLVLPVYEAAGAYFLWDEPNPWRQAWSNHQANPDSLVLLVLPLGDLADLAAIGASQALAGDPARLAAIAQRYGVEDTLVAHAAVVVDLANDVPRLHIGLQRFGPSGEATVIESIIGERRDQVDALLVAGVRQVSERIEEGWKRDTLLHYDAEHRLRAHVPLGGLADWLAVRQRLRTTANIREIELAALSAKNALVVLHYLGAPGQLVLSLAQQDLDLVEEDGFWTLRLRRRGSADSP